MKARHHSDHHRLNTSLLLGAALFLSILFLFHLGSVRSHASSKPESPILYCADRVSESWLSLRWSKAKKADGYYIYRSSSAQGPFKKIATKKGSSSTREFVSEKKNKSHFYMVRAYRKKDGKTIKSDFANIFVSKRYDECPIGILFPDGVPKTEGQMQKYLTTVKLPIYYQGHKRHIHLRVHKKLKKQILKCFQEMYDIRFPIKPHATGSYNWRMMRSVPWRSHHSYGCAVDINWNDNPMCEASKAAQNGYRPGKNPYSITQEVVDIWKNNGFYWGGNWPGTKDYMHFTFTNN